MDSEYLVFALKDAGFSVFHNTEIPADIVIINTCGFINDAKQESVDTILGYIKAKKDGSLKKLFVTGCLSQRYMQELQEELPEVDHFFGINGFSEIPGVLGASINNKNTCKREISAPRSSAFLKISEGCDRKCAFCAIPLIKGKYRSRKIEDVVEEAEWLAKHGVKELIIIAQDITVYGKDIYGKHALASLIKALAVIQKIQWIRLHYMYPEDFSNEMITLIKNENKVCKYIDIPLQHINDDVLKSMQRGINRKKATALIQRIRRDIPGVAIRTTLLVGYPTETEEAFNELHDFVKMIEFDRLGVFTYSHEEHTPAAEKYEDITREQTKLERANIIMGTQNAISRKKNTAKTGKIYDVLIDAEETHFFIGRTQFDSLEVDGEVFIHKTKNTQGIQTGNFYKVRIDKADDYDLYGKII